ncbi:MAG: hypothetical protein EP298_04980 [Gammaproteobacteria bacterium]|nr:MAG: hypothetical protein EP298_04980 [Gammaproteobacteria bacterium]UTW42518.1 hypothetical protein KFE69_13775 [bacterium SCSIO 12844]
MFIAREMANQFLNKIGSSGGVRHSFIALNALNEARQNYVAAGNPDQNALKKLDLTFSTILQETEVNVTFNRDIVGKNEPGLLTTAQIKESFAKFQLLADTEAKLKPYLESAINERFTRMNNIWLGDTVDTRQKEPHKKDNITKQLLGAMEEALIFKKGDKDEQTQLTQYGEQVKQKMGNDFSKAIQLLDNNIATQATIYRSTTDSQYDSLPGSFNTAWKNPSRAFGVEREVRKSDTNPQDLIYCKEHQLKLVDQLQKDGILNSFTKDQIDNNLIRYIERQAEVMVPVNQLEDSQTLFYNAQQSNQQQNTPSSTPNNNP